MSEFETVKNTAERRPYMPFPETGRDRPLYSSPEPVRSDPHASGATIDWTPRAKIATAAGIGGPLTTILAWVAGELGVEMPLTVTAAFATLIIFAVGYLTPERG